MRNLKNWDNNTWLSSKNYILSFHKYLRSEIKFSKKIKILDIGCGRGKIISFLSKKYKLENYPVGVDIVDHKPHKRRVRFVKKDALKFLKSSKDKYDLIIFKQSIHFFNNQKIKSIILNSKKILNKNGKIIICTLNSSKNFFPTFLLFKKRLESSLEKDKIKIFLLKKILKNYKIKNFKFKVKITREDYIKIIKKRFISCLLDLTEKEIQNELEEIKKNYKRKKRFNDQLLCLVYKKKL